MLAEVLACFRWFLMAVCMCTRVYMCMCVCHVLPSHVHISVEPPSSLYFVLNRNTGCEA